TTARPISGTTIAAGARTASAMGETRVRAAAISHDPAKSARQMTPTTTFSTTMSRSQAASTLPPALYQRVRSGRCIEGRSAVAAQAAAAEDTLQADRRAVEGRRVAADAKG